jgi:apolipoprotein N-acyltransferase
MTDQIGDSAAPAAGPARTARPADQGSPPLLVGLWLTMAVGLVVAPFLTFYSYDYLSNAEVVSSYSVNGWGELTYNAADLPVSGHAARLGIVFVVLAIALAAAALTAILRRDRTWPSRVGAIASGMTVAALIVVLLDVEAQASHNVTDGNISTDITIGAGAWVVLLITVLAVIAALISLTRERGPSR